MKAAILSIGDELILGQTQDTNARWLAGRLADRGVPCVQFRVVPDDLAARNAACGAKNRLMTTAGMQAGRKNAWRGRS